MISIEYYRMASRGGYLGGSTVIGPGSGWFSRSRSVPKHDPAAAERKAERKAAKRRVAAKAKALRRAAKIDELARKIEVMSAEAQERRAVAEKPSRKPYAPWRPELAEMYRERAAKKMASIEVVRVRRKAIVKP